MAMAKSPSRSPKKQSGVYKFFTWVGARTELEPTTYAYLANDDGHSRRHVKALYSLDELRVVYQGLVDNRRLEDR